MAKSEKTKLSRSINYSPIRQIEIDGFGIAVAISSVIGFNAIELICFDASQAEKSNVNQLSLSCFVFGTSNVNSMISWGLLNNYQVYRVFCLFYLKRD